MFVLFSVDLVFHRFVFSAFLSGDIFGILLFYLRCQIALETRDRIRCFLSLSRISGGSSPKSKNCVIDLYAPV